MCGRFTLTAPRQILKEWFPLFDFPDLPPRYNIAPTQDVLVVRRPVGSAGEVAWLRWGLVPHWAEDPSIGGRLINARCESVAEKPAFRTPFRQRRCLVLADGFFEWQKLPADRPKAADRPATLFADWEEPTRSRQGTLKQPFHIRLRDGRPFAFAGLWDRWERDGRVIESCTILTTEANELVRPLHDRMPVILPQEHHRAWLDATEKPRDLLLPLLRPYPSKEMMAHPVSQRVNSPRHDDPACVAALGRRQGDN
jgi:putative SOS response-associated peptidase YedK